MYKKNTDLSVVLSHNGKRDPVTACDLLMLGEVVLVTMAQLRKQRKKVFTYFGHLNCVPVIETFTGTRLVSFLVETQPYINFRPK